MTDTDSKDLSIKLPGEWALQKAFGPVLTEMGEDLKRLYATGRDKILAAGYSKIENPDDGKQANLRVTRDVMWNGAFTDDAVCAEYFGGILASSRSEDGKDDSSIQFVDVIKSLSSKQLRLHYLIYNALNKIFVTTREQVNVALNTEIQARAVWLSALELNNVHGVNVDTDFNILFRQGLVSEYKTDTVLEGSKALPYGMAKPTTFGVMLYASAHNRMPVWRSFPAIDFGNFDNIPSPTVFANSIEDLKLQAGLTPPQTQEKP